MDILGFLVGLSLFLFPGALIARKFSPIHASEFLALCGIFSIGVWGAASFLVSFFQPFPFVVGNLALVFALLSLFFFHKDLQKIILLDFQSPSKTFVGGLLFLVFIIIFSIYFLLRFDDLQFDSLSYHLPFIYDFASDGTFSHFESPINNFQLRSNYYPKLFESFTGLLLHFSTIIFKLFPIVPFVLALLFIWNISRQLHSKPSIFPVLFFAGGYLVLLQAISYYVDVFLSALLLGAVYVLLRHRQNMSGPNLECAFFLLGCMLATKLTSFVIVFAVLAWIAWNDFPSIRSKFFSLSTLLLLGGGFFPIFFVFNYFTGNISSFGLAAGNAALLSAESFWEQLLSNSHAVGVVILFFSLFGYFPLVLFPTFIAALRHRATLILQYFRGLTIFGIAIFACYILFTASNARSDTFPRFILPFIGLISIHAGLQWQRWVDYFAQNSSSFALIVRRALVFCMVLMLLVAFFQFVLLLLQREAEHPVLLNIIYEKIPNDTNVVIYFGNTPNSIGFGFENTTIFDYSSFLSTEKEGCDFLQKKGVTHLVIFNPDILRKELGEFNRHVFEDAAAGKCGKFLGSDGFSKIVEITPHS